MKNSSKRLRKKVLVTGCGRSGTKSVCRILNDYGLDVGHEHMRTDGTVSCMFFIDSDWYPDHPWAAPKGLIAHQKERKSQFRFDVTLHQVRHPLKVISSVAAGYDRQHQDWLVYNGVIPEGVRPKLKRAMYIWLEVNKRCEKISKFRYKVEDITTPKVWKVISSMLDIDARPPKETIMNKGHGYTKGRVLRWEDIEEVDYDLSKKIRERANSYGYK